MTHHRSLRNILLVVTLLCLLNGCATIIHGTTQDIAITTDPSGADLSVDGQEHYKSPAKITMKRKDDHVVEVNQDGYQKETINIKSVVSGAVAGNILAGGLIGWGIDAASGGQYRLVPENIDVRLRPLAAQTGPMGTVAKESIEEKLDQLKKLKERGKITEDEYKKMRTEVLATASKEKITGNQPEKGTPPVKKPTSSEPPKAFNPKSDEEVVSE